MMGDGKSVRWPFAACCLLAVTFAGSLGCGAKRSAASGEGGGFLGDYGALESHAGDAGRMTFVAQGVDWSKYYAVHVDSVTLWTAEGSAPVLKDEERQLLTDLLFRSLYDELAKHFLMANQSGPQTLELRAAFTQGPGADVALNVATTMVPALRPIDELGALRTDTSKIAGAARVEVEVRDSLTYRRLAAAVDSGAGDKKISSFETWSDVESAARYWSERVASFLARQGVVQRR